MSLEGGLSNDEVRDVLANNNLHKYYEEGKITLEEYKRLQVIFSKIQTQNKQNDIVLHDEPKHKPKIVPLIVAILIIICIICVIKALAHPGRTDANGGHYNRSTGEYHYHTGEYADQDRSSTATSTGTYVSGYNEGKEVGHRKGYENGYEEGYKEGKEIGYEDGHKDGQREANSTFGGILAFVFIGMAVVSVFKS